MSEEIFFRDFTRVHKPVRFKIDTDVFECVPALGVDGIQEIVQVFRGTQSDDDETAGTQIDKIAAMIGRIREAFKLFLLPDSYTLFLHKLGDRKNPVDVKMLLDITQWIVEIYTKRPTEPSSNSLDSSPIDDGGTSSTDFALETASIPWS